MKKDKTKLYVLFAFNDEHRAAESIIKALKKVYEINNAEFQLRENEYGETEILTSEHLSTERFGRMCQAAVTAELAVHHWNVAYRHD